MSVNLWLTRFVPCPTTCLSLVLLATDYSVTTLPARILVGCMETFVLAGLQWPLLLLSQAQGVNLQILSRSTGTCIQQHGGCPDSRYCCQPHFPLGWSHCWGNADVPTLSAALSTGVAKKASQLRCHKAFSMPSTTMVLSKGLLCTHFNLCHFWALSYLLQSMARPTLCCCYLVGISAEC